MPERLPWNCKSRFNFKGGGSNSDNSFRFVPNSQGNDKCKECKNYQDGPYCVGKCPPFKYPDEEGSCQLCHPDCDLQFGCTGPGKHVGIGGCTACKLHQPLDTLSINSSVGGFTCISPKRGCFPGYYRSYSAFNSSHHKRKKPVYLHVSACLSTSFSFWYKYGLSFEGLHKMPPTMPRVLWGWSILLRVLFQVFTRGKVR